MPPPTEAALGKALLARARRAIAAALGLPVGAEVCHPAFGERGACFVTLRQAGELRGCIGSLQAQRPLGEDLDDNAVGAALRDPRFAPLTANEFAGLQLEVSLLTRPEFMAFGDQDEVLGKLRPGTDGVILFDGCRRATFLPQVWEQLPDPRDFLAQLKRKAGLPAGHWSPSVMIATYQVEKFSEPA